MPKRLAGRGPRARAPKLFCCPGLYFSTYKLSVIARQSVLSLLVTKNTINKGAGLPGQGGCDIQSVSVTDSLCL